MTAKEQLYEVVRDLPEEDCGSFHKFLLVVKEGDPVAMRMAAAAFSDSTHASVAGTLRRLEEVERRSST